MREVVRFAKSLGDDCRFREKKCMAHFPTILKTRILHKWEEGYDTGNWEAIPDKLAKHGRLYTTAGSGTTA